MNAETKVEAGPLAKLREPFPPHHISKLPKPTKKQTDEVRADFKKGIRCKECGAWHHPEVVHLDYVGHAALTDRLLDTDPHWSWEPVAFRDGLPAFDASGGLWIKLTVCGVTRLGYGHAAVKPNQDPGAREKEVIGDALRNAAMRFGAALDLWHKGDLHADEDEAPTPRADPTPASRQSSGSADMVTDAECAHIMALVQASGVSLGTVLKRANVSNLSELTNEAASSVIKKLNLTIKQKSEAVESVLDDDIPY